MKRIIERIAAGLLLLLWMIPAGRVSAAEPVERIFTAMDTVVSIRVFGEKAEQAVDDAVAEITRLEERFSTELADGEIAELNREGTAVVSGDTFALIRRSLELQEETGGAFSPALYPLMLAWGFPQREYRVPSGEEIRELLPLTDEAHIFLEESEHRVTLGTKGMALDLGGIAKGYTSGKLMELFRAAGVEHALVSLGGNVQALGTKPDGSPWRIGIRSPEEGEEFLGVLSVADRAVITSGDYERYFEENGERYHHILDPATGRPAESGVTSVTVVCEDGTLADGLSTALFVMGRERAVAYWQEHEDTFDFILKEQGETLWVSQGLADAFQTERPVEVVERE